MSRYLAYVALLAAISFPNIAAAGHASADASWTCNSTSASTSCVTHPAPVSHPSVPVGIQHRHHGPSFHQ